MKKKIFTISIFIIFGVIILLYIYNVFLLSFNVGYFQNLFNGLRVESRSKIISQFSSEYIQNNFFNDDDEILLLDNYSAFLEYAESRVEYDIKYKDSMYNGEDEINTNIYSVYYNMYEQEKDIRVIEKENKLYLKIKDLTFIDDVDVITYGHFRTYIFKKDYSKKTLSQAQQDMSVEFVDKYKEDGKTIYVYFDTDTNKTIKVAVKTILGFVTSCETVY